MLLNLNIQSYIIVKCSWSSLFNMMMVLRVSVVLVALLVRVNPILGNVPGIMSREDCDDEHCSILDAPHYSGLTEGASSQTNNLESESEETDEEEDSIGETKNNELPQTMLLLPSSEVSKHQPQSSEGGQTMPVFFVQRAEEGGANEAKSQEQKPPIMEPDDEEDDSCETKNDGPQPTMAVVPINRDDSSCETKNDGRQPTMMLVPVMRDGNSGETKNDVTQPTMMVVPVIGSVNGGETKNDVKQPTMMVVPIIRDERRSEQKSTPIKATLLLVPLEDKENEIRNKPKTLEKKEAKAQKEYSTLDACKRNDNEIPEQLKNNHHTKKDLDCDSKNNGLEEDIKIGVVRSGRSLEEEDAALKRIRLNRKRAIDNKQLALQYLAILDNTMGYPYSKSPDYNMNNPWRQFTVASLPPNAYPSLL